MLVFKYHLTSAEYLDYNYFTAWSSPQKRPYRIRYYVRVMTLYIAVAGLYIFAKKSHNPVVDISVFLGVGLLYFLLVPVLVKRSIRIRVRQILARPENHHVLSESRVALSERGIEDADEANQNSYEWGAITRKAETQRCFYLYTNSYHAIVIPKRVVSDADGKTLDMLFARHLPLYADLGVQ